jgi:hypothetical protein
LYRYVARVSDSTNCGKLLALEKLLAIWQKVGAGDPQLETPW